MCKLQRSGSEEGQLWTVRYVTVQVIFLAKLISQGVCAESFCFHTNWLNTLAQTDSVYLPRYLWLLICTDSLYLRIQFSISILVHLWPTWAPQRCRFIKRAGFFIVKTLESIIELLFLVTATGSHLALLRLISDRHRLELIRSDSLAAMLKELGYNLSTPNEILTIDLQRDKPE